LWIGLSNIGRGLAKFPGIRFKQVNNGLIVNPHGLDGNGNNGLPPRLSDRDWFVFRGGVDDVIYPGSTLKITQLLQRYSRGDPRKGVGIFDSVNFVAEVSCEGFPTTIVEKLIPPDR
jgi:hypothetical protein